jgi:peptidoglycan/xylan/chitin deacetylase (PgdA/CDA1 family)
MRDAPGTGCVQFVDGDCELRDGWIEAGLGALAAHADVAVVCGRRRERDPEASVYNRLCDVEWDTPVGEARACGGDSLVRAEAFSSAGGFDPGMIAGEEPDLCLRLRRLGHRILRLDVEMTLHDAAMTRWTQWRARAVRAGHTTAELLAKYGATPEHGRLRRVLSALFWALAVPLGWLALAVAVLTSGWGLGASSAVLLAPALAYALLLARIARSTRRRGRTPADARAYAVSCVLAKWPELWGVCLYLARRATGRAARWVEYKDPPQAARRAAPPASSKQRLRWTADRTAQWTGLLGRRERETAGGLTALMYHRVLEDEDCADYPFPALAMPRSAFRAQVAWLARHGEVLPLAQALQRGEREAPGARPPVPRYALTFDDGYSDACEIVAEELEAAGVRGTFFVTTGFVGSDAPLWFDRAALLFTALPERGRREAVLGACGDALAAHLPPPGADVRAWTALLKRGAPAERDAILDALEAAVGGMPAADGYRGLSVSQLVDLHRRGHEIGSHTVTHPILPALDDAALAREIADARRALAGWLGTDVAGFCYPNGDHDERVVARVARAGHAYACTTLDGIHYPGDDPFRIRRVGMVWDRVAIGARRFDPTAFRRELCGLYRRRGRPAVGN